MPRVRILMVCMGNICRSPLAEGVFKALVEEAGLSEKIEIESAGTHFYHVGEAPDPRSIQVAKENGYSIEEQRSQQLSLEDFKRFDYLLVMDKRNLRDAKSLCPDPVLESKLKLFLDFSREPLSEMEVPDPYTGGAEGFKHVLSLVESASRGLLAHLQEEVFTTEKA